MKQERVTEILEFIFRRWGDTNAHWLDGNCYWFSHILCSRFPDLKKYYMPVEGHFVAGNGVYFFDWTGLVEVSSTIYELDDIERFDDLWYAAIIRDCVE